MMEWYYILGIISYGIFLIQFILSFIGGEIDMDVDFDGELDFSVSDLVSFKGLIHFLMGLSGWLIITREISVINIAIACLVGFLFVVVLYYMYKLALNLQSTPTRKEGLELVGSTATVYLITDYIFKKCCICTICNNNITEEINCIASSPIKSGDKCTIINYKDGIYYISKTC